MSVETEPAAVGGPAEEPTVAHLNYSFFHSTQSFIYFYLRALEGVRSICLTRAPESPVIETEVPPELRGNLFTYPDADTRPRLAEQLVRGGIALRRFLAARSPRLAEPALALLNGRVVPRLRGDADPARFLAWAEAIMWRTNTRLIHAYFGPIGWRALELKRRLGVPLVVTFLGDEVAPSVAPWWDWWISSGERHPDWPRRLGELFADADLLLAEGPYLREHLIELGCPPEKVEVQRIAIPVSELPFQPRPRNPGAPPVIVFAGRFCEQKGVLYALEAVRRLHGAGEDFEFRMIGDDTLTDGSYAAQVGAFVRDHDLGDCVRMLGFLNHRDYLAELERGDIFLHPSVVDSEGRSEGGAPTTIIEAQALGMPIVATEHCDIPHVTVPGESAVLVPERDSTALTEALRSLLSMPGRWEAMGRAGRRFVEANHDIALEAPRLGQRYAKLVGAGAGSPPPARSARG